MARFGKMNEQIKEAAQKIGIESIDNMSMILENPESDGLDIIKALLSMPDKDFEVLRPIFEESLLESYSDPQIQIQLANLFIKSGISIQDLITNIDEIGNNLFGEEIELSEPKQDFIKTFFTAIANTISASTIVPGHAIEIPVELCRENAKLPTYATDKSAAMDIYSPEEYNIDCGKSVIIPIGIKVAIPHGYALIIQPRSGLSARTKLRIANTPGLIDEDYHEEIGVIIENIDIPVKDIDLNENNETVKLYGSPITIGKGERFAQMRLIEVPRVKWRQINSLGVFKDNHGDGFGSTGVN